MKYRICKKNESNLPGSSFDSSLSEISEFTPKMMSAHEIKLINYCNTAKCAWK